MIQTLILISCAIVGMLISGQCLAENPEQPNVIFFLADDMGYSDVSCYGAKKVATPNIDAVAASGIRFTDFHTGSSICSPSRAAFLTGSYPQRCGLYMGINRNRPQHWFLGLNPDEITLAEQFKSKNYQTAMIGKWHLGSEPEFHPSQHGFDSHYGMADNAGHSTVFYDNEKIVYQKTPLNQLTKLYTQRAVEIIKGRGDQPFFLYFAHNYPHTPYKAGKDFVKSSKDGVRGDVIQELDWGFGEIMKALKEEGIDENTIVIFTSDNGPLKQEYAAPYRGTKFVTLEGGQRVPFIFHWPAKIKQGSVSDTPIVAMDLFPTLSEIIDQPLPADRTIDGVSLVPLLSGRPIDRPDDQPFYYYNCENLQAVRYGSWKLHLTRTKEQVPFWEKNMAFTKLESPVLYNLESDVSESSDVASMHPDVVRQMLSMADETRQELGEFMQRGSGQRPTGSVIVDGPVISHEKDWDSVDLETRAAIKAEHRLRHPELFRIKNPKKAGKTKRGKPKTGTPAN